MKTEKIIMLLFLLIIFFTVDAMGQFWYGTNGPITLQIDSQKVVIKLDDTVSIQTQEDLLLSVERIVTILEDEQVLEVGLC